MSDEPRWLTAAEMDAWLPLLAVINLLPQALDQQLRTDAGISHVYYSMLALLSNAPDRTMTMGELARDSFTSPSRLTHAVASMEKRGWVARCADPENRRIQNVSLTDNGVELLVRIAPGHVDEVRRRVFDRLSPAQVDQLRDIASTLAEQG
ncbi:MarR family transcriptional regulator [Gordonia sp. PDNC005]|uniref:MarR family winged helix-turn-helix transcriptional regulator n=1 Tax=unclassified Gordonia (in: high G+C Gram-positive bacteria) TaxID=2657482 RepID=UPI0019651A18|nr:MarR family transcriptional regulator [Gordonia sp. PDNC005]QRY61379.1 MarR family transcriptional regulator [Gordonia sp. PDNC005]